MAAFAAYFIGLALMLSLFSVGYIKLMEPAPLTPAASRAVAQNVAAKKPFTKFQRKKAVAVRTRRNDAIRSFASDNTPPQRRTALGTSDIVAR